MTGIFAIVPRAGPMCRGPRYAEYGFGIDVPDAERTEGRVIPGPSAASGAPSAQLVHVLSGASAPADAYAAGLFRGRWYWIADRDITSKLRFTLLMIRSRNNGSHPCAS